MDEGVIIGLIGRPTTLCHLWPHEETTGPDLRRSSGLELSPGRVVKPACVMCNPVGGITKVAKLGVPWVPAGPPNEKAGPGKGKACSKVV